MSSDILSGLKGNHCKLARTCASNCVNSNLAGKGKRRTMTDKVKLTEIYLKVTLTQTEEGIVVMVGKTNSTFQYDHSLPAEMATNILQGLYAKSEVVSIRRLDSMGLTGLVKTLDGVAEVFRAISSRLPAHEVVPEPAPALATVTSGPNGNSEAS